MVDMNAIKSESTLYASLDYWYEKLRRDAGVKEKAPNGGSLNMRSVRCYHATEWVKVEAEYKFMGFDMAPPNPLQHASRTLTVNTYAEKDAGNEEEAIKRC